MDWKTLFIVTTVISGFSFGAHAADDSEAGQTQQTETAAAQKCRKASVNPVTGHTFCLEPRGAPVEQPDEMLNKPCRKRAHDDDPFTVYERYSACD